MKTSTKLLLGFIMMGLLASFASCESKSGKRLQEDIVDNTTMPMSNDDFVTVMFTAFTVTPIDTVVHNWSGNFLTTRKEMQDMKDSLNVFCSRNNVHPDNVWMEWMITNPSRFFAMKGIRR